jgi:hypothetical protein
LFCAQCRAFVKLRQWTACASILPKQYGIKQEEVRGVDLALERRASGKIKPS